MRGRKRFALLPPDVWREVRLYPRIHPSSRMSQLDLDLDLGALDALSALDLDAPGLDVRERRSLAAAAQQVTLEQGDLLYM